ncbi:MAG: gamma-glutamyl-gamma-aminobutyrate hydrolase family protein [Deltaproteobacteria bacterium]|nr:gamma-glutamyl-gamma-aminobutyrate hydrolase family protein [Deltaproteobacteria bacterium]
MDSPRVKRPRIGISSYLVSPDPSRAAFGGKELLALGRSMLHYVTQADAVPVVLLPWKDQISVNCELIKSCDGLILTGGADISPQQYGEEPLKPEWSGQPERDAAELALIKEALDLKIPILGICRGCQLINVAFGGSLFQDIAAQCPTNLCHRNPAIYDLNAHPVKLAPNNPLVEIFEGREDLLVNAVHHQAVDKLGKGLEAIARAEDGIVEAIWRPNPRHPLVLGVQWHPEWIASHRSEIPAMADQTRLIKFFVQECESEF